jgi:hypothetical protein
MSTPKPLLDETQYNKETQTVVYKGKPVKITHLTPILTPAQRSKRKREAELQLYEVFIKYKK